MTLLAVTEMVMIVLVSIDAVLIQPCGPRMCEQIAKAKGIKINYQLNTNQTANHVHKPNEHFLNANHIAGNITSTFYSSNLTCLLLDPELNVDNDEQTTFKKAYQSVSADKHTCFNRSGSEHDNMQMRCVMCTEFSATLMCEVVCQHVHVHTICAFISGSRSCVFTTKQEQSRKSLGYCTKVSTRKQRQMKCVMVSRLTTTRHMKTCSRDFIQVDNHTVSHYVSGLRPGSIRRANEICKSNQLTKNSYLNGTNSINCLDSKRLPLHTCVKEADSFELFDFFLSLGSQLLIRSDLIDTGGRDLLHIACMNCKLRIVKRMVVLGFDVESRVKENNRTPILLAARYGCYDVVIYLYQIGCDITTHDKHNSNILHLAFMGKDPSVVSFILGLNVSRVMLEESDRAHSTPLLYGAKYGVLKGVKLLVQKGCNIRARYFNGETALHLAAKYGHLDIVKYIVSLRVLHTNCTDNSGYTPLQMVMKTCASKKTFIRRKCHKGVGAYLKKIRCES